MRYLGPPGVPLLWFQREAVMNRQLTEDLLLGGLHEVRDGRVVVGAPHGWSFGPSADMLPPNGQLGLRRGSQSEREGDLGEAGADSSKLV